MKKNLDSREDVQLMVKTFYESVFEDVMLAPIFITSLGKGSSKISETYYRGDYEIS